MCWHEKVGVLISQKLYDEARREISLIEPTKETKVYMETYQAILSDKSITKEEINKIFIKYKWSHIPFMLYGKYILNEQTPEASITYIRRAISLCSSPSDRIALLYMLVFLMVYAKEPNEAFLYAHDLYTISAAQHNAILFFWVCSLTEDSVSQDIKKEIKRVKEVAKDFFFTPSTPSYALGNTIIEENEGLNEFLAENGVSPIRESETEVGVRSTLCTPYDKLIEAGRFIELFTEYSKNQEKIISVDPVINGLMLMRLAEDTFLLFKISEEMFNRKMYYSCCIIYQIIIRIFQSLNANRYKFLSMSFSLRCPQFFSIAKMAVGDTPMFHTVTKNRNICLLLLEQGKGNTEEDPQLAAILQKEFSLEEIPSEDIAFLFKKFS
ncbi:hypothetical protein NEFER03_0244 [Nematocida sp. LUAm3]|nr:hypothetical protein NEFER03_0244 [Nematocida sp. LUAm3]KAI5173697.1 hypothetical protein NEFER02_0213 [Nematocida sp. LUAm2]KAI5176919.1 hypothetical protein NEFER01_0244 [Nematocida sp. LUAm1]